MKLFKPALIILLGCLPLLMAQAEPTRSPSALEILKAVDAKMFPNARTELVLYTSRAGKVVDEQRFTALSRDLNQLILVRFTSPSNLVGRDLLFRGRDVWLHDPSNQREVRIPASETYGASHFSFGDVVRLNYSNNYQPKILSQSDKSWKLELTGLDRGAPYYRILLEVSPEYDLQRGICYSRSGEIIKQMQWSDIQSRGGVIKPVKLVVISPLEPESMSILIVLKEEMQNFPDNIFNRRNLGARLEEKE